MINKQDLLAHYSAEFNKLYKKRKIILSFEEFNQLLGQNPKAFMRDASHYLTDVFSHYGEEKVQFLDLLDTKKFNIFGTSTEKERKIIGEEKVQNEIFHTLHNFQRKGFVDKLIFLYGPSGSSKSLVIDKIMRGMENYSQEKEGAVYTFNWIFPTNLDSQKDKSSFPQKIGFNSEAPKDEAHTFAYLPENLILSKIQSEFKENPLFLIPMPFRERFLRSLISKKKNIKEEDVFLPSHILTNGLSKKNQEIFENLLTIYNGELNKVLRHVQIERFFYSSQYRVGISSVDPQVGVDAYEKQITINGNYHKLPAYLHDINFHESYGELVDANRGLIEYSDILSRPLAQVKQLLNIIERRYVKLSSCIAQMDLVFISTTNTKHMEALKQTPEFNSFRGHLEPIVVPFLLLPSQEKEIYKEDIKNLEKELKVCPHTLDLLALWAVLSRIKPCDLEEFSPSLHPLLKRLGPREKISLYEGECLLGFFNEEEEKKLLGLRQKIWQISKEGPDFEGSFGPSPRDVLELLHKAAQRSQDGNLTPMNLFEELEEFSKQNSSYEFLNYEPEGDYHNQKSFLEILKKEYAQTFELEITQSMLLSNKNEYVEYLELYIKNVVAHLKGEKLLNTRTKNYESPSHDLMRQVEKILKIEHKIESYRSDLLNKIAAYKIENPGKTIVFSRLFAVELSMIRNFFVMEQRKLIEKNYQSILEILSPEGKTSMQGQDMNDLESTFRSMEKDFGYTKESILNSIRFITRKSPSESRSGPSAPSH